MLQKTHFGGRDAGCCEIRLRLKGSDSELMLALLINIAAAIALLLWSVRLIRTGVERAFSGPLRTGLRHASKSRVTATFGGALAAIAMQSSTAVAMLIAAFASSRTLVAATGLAVILGADLGSAIATRILLLPVDALISFLLLGGVVLFLRAATRRSKQFGRILIGLALVLVSLSMMRTATAPLQDNSIVDMLVSYLASDLFSAFLLGAFIAWAMHSSVAAILMVVTMTAEGLLGAHAAIALVLGANLGGALIPVWLTLKADMPARRIMMGNLILRGGGALLAFFAISRFDLPTELLGPTAASQAINLHLVFNVAVVVMSLPLAGVALRFAKAILPERNTNLRNSRISALDPATLGDPDRALASATREVLAMGEMVHQILGPALVLLKDWDQQIADQIKRTDKEVGEIHLAIKLFIARLQERKLTPVQMRKAEDIAAIANHFKDACDQISKNMVAMASQLQAKGLAFSEEGWRDLTNFHDRVTSNTQLGLNVLVSGDLETAIQLVEEKDRTRDAEQELQANHLKRLSEGIGASLETSNQHQETIRALKQINSAFSYVAYPITKETGVLLSSRLASS